MTGFARIIAPWSEALRYAPKKHGYHGGATPQEVLVPVGVFVRSEDAIEGWEPLPARKPAWWNGGEIRPVEVLTAPPRRPQPRGQSATRQASLFTGLDTSGAEGSPAGWINHLLGSPIFAAQRRMAGRRALDDGTVEAFLSVLDRHHDRLSQHALAQALGQPEFRMRGMFVALQRLLNVEGYQVIAIDEATETIELNRPLLAKQFQLPSCLQ